MSDKVIQIKDGNDNAFPNIIVDSGTTGIKFHDGTLIRWKEHSFASGDYASTIYWDSMFTSILTVMCSTDTADVTSFAVINNNNSVSIGRRPATVACTVRILAIGRWK